MLLKTISQETAFFGVITRRFFECLGHVTYQNTPLCRHLYYQFLPYINARWRLPWCLENVPYIREGIEEIESSDVYSLFDEPYHCKSNPGGIILMRGGFGDIVSPFLPAERTHLLCPNQGEVDLIRLNCPQLQAHNIEALYQPNPKAIASLSKQISQAVASLKDDPIFGSQLFLDGFLQQIPNVVQRFDAVQQLMDHLNIGAVLTVSTIHWFGSTLNLIARANQIPSVSIQHGIITDKLAFAHVPILCTKKAVWGEDTKEWYRKFGFPDSRVCVTGSPRFDIIFNQTWGGKNKICNYLQIDPQRRIIVFAAQALGNVKIDILIKTIFEGLRDLDNIFLLIMLHPNEKPAFYQKLTQGYPHCRVTPFGEISLYDALSAADLFLTCFSAAAVEAMLFKVPAITVEPFDLNFSFGKLGATPYAHNSEELKALSQRILTEASYRVQVVTQSRRFLSGFCIPDGSTSGRLVAEIENLCRYGGSF